MALVADLAAGAFFALGVCMVLIGAFGMLRLPDVYTRMHAASLIDTLGLLSILIGLIIHVGFDQAAIKLALVFLFVLFASPTATHALARAALFDGIRPQVEPNERARAAEEALRSKP